MSMFVVKYYHRMELNRVLCEKRGLDTLEMLSNVPIIIDKSR
jgi:hypothetical protein